MIAPRNTRQRGAKSETCGQENASAESSSQSPISYDQLIEIHRPFVLSLVEARTETFHTA